MRSIGDARRRHGRGMSDEPFDAGLGTDRSGPAADLREQADLASDRFPEGVAPPEELPEDDADGVSAPGAGQGNLRAGTPAADSSTLPGQGREPQPRPAPEGA
jgi:hypothetical protein